MDGFLWMVFAHVIGDIALQSDWLAQNKGKYFVCMIWHSVIWTGCICLALNWLGIEVRAWKVAFLLSGHFVMDEWKCNSTKKFPTWHLYFDQAWHLVQCWAVFILN